MVFFFFLVHFELATDIALSEGILYNIVYN